MTDAFKTYRDENDIIKTFIDTMCELPPSGLSKEELKDFYVNAGTFREAGRTAS
jgi:phage/plasmid-associated DNA primase